MQPQQKKKKNQSCEVTAFITQYPHVLLHPPLLTIMLARLSIIITISHLTSNKHMLHLRLMGMCSFTGI